MILCLDLETTSLNEQTGGLIEIGAVWLHSDSYKGGEFFRACRPQSLAIFEKGALEVNGYTEERAKDTNRLPEAMAVIELLGWARGAIDDKERIQIAAWNAHFDHRHLRAALARAGVDERYSPFPHRLIDLHSLVAGEHMRGRLNHGETAPPLWGLGNEIANADQASALLGLEPEKKPHDALAGARQVRAMLRRFLGDSGALP